MGTFFMYVCMCFCVSVRVCMGVWVCMGVVCMYSVCVCVYGARCAVCIFAWAGVGVYVCV